VQALLGKIKERDPDQPEFLQAVDEVLHTVTPVLSRYPQHFETIKRLVEPERTIIFRVPWCVPEFKLTLALPPMI
jgi:glutamate dehydrogenase (NADP+)